MFVRVTISQEPFHKLQSTREESHLSRLTTTKRKRNKIKSRILTVQLLLVERAGGLLLALVVVAHGGRDVRVVGVALVEELLDLGGGQPLHQLVDVQLVERVRLRVAGRADVDDARHIGRLLLVALPNSGYEIGFPVCLER